MNPRHLVLAVNNLTSEYVPSSSIFASKGVIVNQQVIRTYHWQALAWINLKLMWMQPHHMIVLLWGLLLEIAMGILWFLTLLQSIPHLLLMLWKLMR